MKKVALIVAVALACSAVLYAAAKEYGTVKTADKNVAVEFNFDGQKAVFTSKEKRIPAGDYNAKEVNVMVRSKSGVYTFQPYVRTGQIAYTLSVTKDEATELGWAPPFTFKPIRYQSSVKDGIKTIPIGFSMTDKNGASFMHEIKIGSKTVPAPSFQIEDETGKVLASGKFEYG
jgi:hypothetical protein